MVDLISVNWSPIHTHTHTNDQNSHRNRNGYSINSLCQYKKSGKDGDDSSRQKNHIKHSFSLSLFFYFLVINENINDSQTTNLFVAAINL